MSFLTTSIQPCDAVLSEEIRKEIEIKVIQIRNEEVKVSLFAHDMILYLESPKDATRETLELID